MTKGQAEDLLKVASDQVPLGIYGVAKGNHLELRRDRCDSKSQAKELALQTKGYAFAYQCLGYLLIKEGKTQADEAVLSKLDHYLEEGVYNKLWRQMSAKEKEILSFIAQRGSVSNEDIFEKGLLTPSTISTYKSSLSKKGVVDASRRGYMSLALPRFAEFILAVY